MRYGILFLLLLHFGCAGQPESQVISHNKGAKSGYCVIEVTVTKEGTTKNEKIVECKPEGYGFGKASLKAAAKLKYNPRIIDGKPVEVPGVLYKFTFTLNE